MMVRLFRYSFLATISLSFASAMTIAEKREELQKEGHTQVGRQELRIIHDAIAEKKDELSKIYEEIQSKIFPLDQEDNVKRDEQLKELSQYREKILGLRKSITSLEGEWRTLASESQDSEFEGLWHQPDATIGQLVIDYAPGDFVYLMPPEVAGLKVHVSSRLSVPKASWSEMLELILASVGVGVKQISPFVKQLYFLKMNQSGIFQITEDRDLLVAMPQEAKVAFVCSPPTGDQRRIMQFLEKFVSPEQVIVQIVGGHLVLVGNVREISDVMKVYDFIASPKRAQEHKIVTLKGVDSEEMAKILLSIFEGESSSHTSQSGPEAKPTMFVPQETSFGFRVISLKYPASSLFLMGKHEQIEKACEIIKEIEESIGEVQEKGINYYACRHSEAEELAKVLSQVYTKLVGMADGQERGSSTESLKPKADKMTRYKETIQAREHAEDALIVDSSLISSPTAPSSSTPFVSENFIVDQKTNSIIMVVEKSMVPRLKELLHRLDVPKRMVQIDVLLFEKKIVDSSSIGLNLLRTGDAATDKSREWLTWNDPKSSKEHKRRGKDKKKDSGRDRERGILEFFISKGSHGWLPAFDVAYQFLLGQDDIQINANPSITTVNQTPAKIAVVDQISINTGAVEMERDYVKESYSRAEYGVTIQITPTVHAKIDEESEDGPKYVTLTTDILFDSQHPTGQQDRPDVTRRNIKNEVRVQDGETVILGGLRRKDSTGSQQSIPFLGEIPGLGKLFSSTRLQDTNSEMFVFLTPRILPDDHEKWVQARYQELVKRPGDTPEFLQDILEAKVQKKEQLMARSWKMIFDGPKGL